MHGLPDYSNYPKLTNAFDEVEYLESGRTYGESLSFSKEEARILAEKTWAALEKASPEENISVSHAALLLAPILTPKEMVMSLCIMLDRKVKERMEAMGGGLKGLHGILKGIAGGPPKGFTDKTN